MEKLSVPDVHAAMVKYFADQQAKLEYFETGESPWATYEDLQEHLNEEYQKLMALQQYALTLSVGNAQIDEDRAWARVGTGLIIFFILLIVLAIAGANIQPIEGVVK